MKEFKTIEEQIELLKSRNLKFINEQSAKDHLLSYGYYEIINGYKDYFLTSSDPDSYKSGSTFEQIFSLYNMDKGLQEGVLSATLDFERILKTTIAYAIAEEYSSDQDKYLQKANYKTGKAHKDKNGHTYFDIDSVFKKFEYIINDDVEPFKHYRLKHENTPPWILFKGATLGNMLYFYKLQKPDIKNRIISLMFDIPIDFFKIDKNGVIKNFFSDLLSLNYSFRNRTAHSGRIYNYKSEKSSMRHNVILHSRLGIDNRLYRQGFGRNDLYTLLCGLSFLKDKTVSIKLAVHININIKKYLDLYPEDKPKILNSIGIPPNKCIVTDDKIIDIMQLLDDTSK